MPVDPGQLQGDRLAAQPVAAEFHSDGYDDLTIVALKEMLDGAAVTYRKKASHGDLVKLARSEIG